MATQMNVELPNNTIKTTKDLSKELSIPMKKVVQRSINYFKRNIESLNRKPLSWAEYKSFDKTAISASIPVDVKSALQKEVDERIAKGEKCSLQQIVTEKLMEGVSC